MSSNEECKELGNLENFSYGELVNIARSLGINNRLKKENLLKEISRANESGLDSFVTDENVLLNSNKKNKEEKFDKDKEVSPETSRRSTYSLEAPSPLILNKVMEESTMLSPDVDMPFCNVSFIRGSDRKLRSHKSRNSEDLKMQSPILDSSFQNVSLSRGSERKLRGRKVSFMTPTLTPRSSKRSSIRDRPKTPIVTRSSISKRVSFITPDKPKRKSRGKSLPPTPHPKNLSLNEMLKKTSDGDQMSIQDIPEELALNNDEIVNKTPDGEMFLQDVPEELVQSDVFLTPEEGIVNSTLIEHMETENIGERSDAQNEEHEKVNTTTVGIEADDSAKTVEQNIIDSHDTPVAAIELEKETSTKGTPKKSFSKRISNLSSSKTDLRASSSAKKNASAKDVNNSSASVKWTGTPYSMKRRSSIGLETKAKAAKLPGSSKRSSFASTKKIHMSKTPGSAQKRSPFESGKKIKASKTPSSAQKRSSFESGKKIKTSKTLNAAQKRSSFGSEKKIKASKTPNFKKIHQKAFEKMESIDDYHKRKTNSVKKLNQKIQPVKKATKIPKLYSGIPFVPTVTSSKNLKLNFTEEKEIRFTSVVDNNPKSSDVKASTLSGKRNLVKKERNAVTPKPEASENLMPKQKFDLQKSLSRKLGYKPHKGPLKPLTESNANFDSCYHKNKTAPNEVVVGNRIRSRGVLKGVRMNKRFELQMRNRKI